MFLTIFLVDFVWNRFIKEIKSFSFHGVDFCSVHFFGRFFRILVGFVCILTIFWVGFVWNRCINEIKNFSFHALDFCFVGMGFGQFFWWVLYQRDEEREFFFPFLTRTPYDFFCAFWMCFWQFLKWHRFIILIISSHAGFTRCSIACPTQFLLNFSTTFFLLFFLTAHLFLSLQFSKADEDFSNLCLAFFSANLCPHSSIFCWNFRIFLYSVLESHADLQYHSKTSEKSWLLGRDRRDYLSFVSLLCSPHFLTNLYIYIYIYIFEYLMIQARCYHKCVSTCIMS